MNKPLIFYVSDSSVATKPYHYTECGLDNVWLLDGYTIETVDGEEYVSITDADGLWKAIGLDLVANRKSFSPKEIRFLRTQMGKTQAELAAILRVDDQTVARWEKKRCKMPGPADLAIRFLFLTSEVAQPEGREIINKFHQMIGDIVETDDPSSDDVHFAPHNMKWESQRLAV